MKLINEAVESVEIITEGASADKISIKGPFIHCEERNRNGRIYIKEHMIPEVSRYIKEYVDTKRSVGELCHPDSPTINPDRVSHLITKLEWDGPLCMGEAKLLDTPTGKILKSFVKEGVSFGVSTRGLGSIQENNGIKYVQPDFRLITVDAVMDPSGIKCWTDGVMENKDWVYIDGKGWVEQYIEESRKEIKKASAKDVEKVALKIFENYLSRL